MDSKTTATHEQKEADSRLQRFHLKLALDAANMGIWDWNLQTGGVRWSDNVEQIIGLKNKFDGKAQTYLDSIIKEDREFVAKTINHAIKNKIDFSVEHRVLLKGSVIRWIEGNGKVIFDEKGKAVSLTGTVRDITDRKKNEEDLKQRDLIFATLAHVTSEFILHANWEDAISSVLKALGEMMKVDRVYIFQNDGPIDNKIETASQRYEWNSSDTAPQMDNPELQHLPIAGNARDRVT